MYRGCERSVITYSSLISACEKAGQVSQCGGAEGGRWGANGGGMCYQHALRSSTSISAPPLDAAES